MNPEDAWIVTDEVVAIPHPDPIATCHLLIVPRRHVAAFYDLDVAEQHHVWDILRELQHRITGSLRVEGFDAGFVDAEQDDPSAHAHVHLIPRIAGELVELRSGIQWVNLDS